jgi:hypothetical protein
MAAWSGGSYRIDRAATVDNEETRAAFLAGADVLAGTQGLWTQHDYFEGVDVLFIDEAGRRNRR